MKKVLIGIIQKPFGIKGEVKVASKTDFEAQRFKVGNELTLELNGNVMQVTIETMRRHHGSVLLKFRSMDSLNDVEFFHRGQLYIDDESRHELEAGQFYFSDLEGCDCYVDDALIGNVVEVMETPAHPVLRIRTKDRDVLVPFVERFVKNVNSDSKRIDIDWMEGL